GVDYSWDKAGRLLSENSYGRQLSFQYDQGGNRTRVTYPDALYEQYGYDALNRVTTIKENNASTLATYSYDNVGRRRSITRLNGTSTSFAYDGASRLTSLTQNLASTAQDLTLGTLTYNPASQLLSRPGSNDAYGWAGPGTGQTYVPDKLNRYTSVGGTA